MKLCELLAGSDGIVLLLLKRMVLLLAAEAGGDCSSLWRDPSEAGRLLGAVTRVVSVGPSTKWEEVLEYFGSAKQGTR